MTEIIGSKDGLRTVRIDGQYLLSMYSPKRDIERILASVDDKKQYYYILFGSSLGYPVNLLLNSGVELNDIAIVEPDSLLEADFKAQYPTIAVYPEGKGMAGWIEKKLSDRKKPYLLTLESYKKLFPKEYQIFSDRYKDETRAAVENLKVSAYFAKSWIINYFRNLTLLTTDSNRFGIARLDDPGKFETLVVAAGPSLNESVSAISNNRERFIILSVLSAARTLLNAGIRPDYLVITDAGPGNILHGAGIPDNIPILASVYASSAYLSQVKNKVFYIDLMKEIENPCFEVSNPSVTIDAGELALKMSTLKPVFAGFDLSYTLSAGSHSAGNAFITYRSSNYNRLNPLMGQMSAFLKKNDLLTQDGYITTNSFLMLQNAAAKKFPGSYHYGRGLPISGTRRLSHLEENAKVEKSYPPREKIAQKICGKLTDYENQLVLGVLSRLSQELRIQNSPVFSRFHLREHLAGSEISKSNRYYTEKIEKIRNNLQGISSSSL